jgi:nucleotide-binding universal stress UspA family protein
MKKIILATDFSEISQRAYPATVALANSLQAHIELVHEVVLPPTMFIDELQASLAAGSYYDQLRLNLESEAKHEAFRDTRVTTKLCYHGSKEPRLVDYAQIAHADLIVQATRGRTGMVHAVLGSFAERTARYASMPVLTYRDLAQEQTDTPYRPHKLLVPIDLSENSKAILPVVRSFWQTFNSELRFVHVLPEISVRGDWGNVQEKLRVSHDTAVALESQLNALLTKEFPEAKISVEIRFGDAYREILKEAGRLKTDLIVLATHGWTGLDHLYFGSVAEKVIRAAPCSVLTLRPTQIHAEPGIG